MATTNTTDLNKTNQAQLINTGTDPNSVALGGTNSTGTTTAGTTTTTTPSIQTYMDAYNQLAQQLTNANNESVNALKTNLAANKQSTTDKFNSNARQAYVNYAKNQNALKEQLASMGINGGASESATANLYNNYAQNVGNNNTALGTALNDLQLNYNDQVATLNNTLAQTLANAQYEAQQNDIARQDTLNAQALEQYATTMDRFTTVDACKKEINKLDPSDPNYQAKVQLLQLRMAQIKAAKKSGSSGGGTSTGGSTAASGGSGNGGSGKSGGIVLVTSGGGSPKKTETTKVKGTTSKAQDAKGVTTDKTAWTTLKNAIKKNVSKATNSKKTGKTYTSGKDR